MRANPKRDAQKTEDAGLVAESQFKATVTKPDVLPIDRNSNAGRLDRLDRERASDEGMLAPSEDS